MHRLYSQLKAVAVIQVQADRNRHFLRLGFHDRRISLNRSVFDRTRRRLEHDRRFQFLSGSQHRLHHFHVLDVERTDRITALLRVQKHFF